MTRSYDKVENEDAMYCIVEIGDDDNKRYLVNNIRGYLPTTIISFVMNLHPEARPIYFSRHGQSMYNVEDRIGGDSSLTEYGLQYAKKLGERIGEIPELPAERLVVWTSCLKRTQETAQFIRCRHRVRWQALNEIGGGACEDLTYKEMEERFPELAELRRKDKLNFRYPQWTRGSEVTRRGESYIDIIDRLQPVVFELERNTQPIIVVSHQAVLRCLLAYFLDIPRSRIPYISLLLEEGCLTTLSDPLPHPDPHRAAGLLV